MGKVAQTYLAAIVLCVWQSSISASAAQKNSGPPVADQPVDIQANEQQFAGDTVIAKGNVVCKYKDSTVYAPQATLYRTPDGQAQKAVFIGHPHLVQGDSRMDADTLIFEIIEGNVIADGHAHSEVNANGDSDSSDKGKEAQVAGASGAGNAPGKEAADAGSKGAKADAGAKANAGVKADANGTDLTKTAGADDKSGAAGDTASGDKKKKKVVNEKPTHAMSPEMIVTDSDHQEYAKEIGKFLANGHVHVKTSDIVVKSEKLQLVYGTDSRPESAVFTGNVDATQYDNDTKADNVIYFLQTQRLQATGNVRSKCVQKQDPKKGGPKTSDAALDPAALGDLPDDQVIFMDADAQDYTRESGRIACQGNVHLRMNDIEGFGPACAVQRNAEGQAERVVFSGRSQVNQPGRRWIGDMITLTVIDHKVLAEGNTRAIIVQQPAKAAPTVSPVPTAPTHWDDDAKFAHTNNETAIAGGKDHVQLAQSPSKNKDKSAEASQ